METQGAPKRSRAGRPIGRKKPDAGFDQYMKTNLAKRKRGKAPGMKKKMGSRSNQNIKPVSANKKRDKAPTMNCRVQYFLEKLKSISDEQRKWVFEMHFDSLLRIASTRLPRQLCYWLLTRFDPLKRELEIREDYSLEVSSNVIGWILGIPSGGYEVPIKCHELDLAKMKKKYGNGLGGLSLACIESIMCRENCSESEFKESFLLFALGTLLCPTQSLNISPSLLVPASVAMEAEKYNWGLFILEWMVRSATRFKKEYEQKSHVPGVGGCVIALAISYLDRISMPKPVSRNIYPRIAAWTDGEIRSAEKLDRINGETFGKAEVVRVSYGQKNNDEESWEEYRKSRKQCDKSFGDCVDDNDTEYKVDWPTAHDLEGCSCARHEDEVRRLLTQPSTVVGGDGGRRHLCDKCGHAIPGSALQDGELTIEGKLGGATSGNEVELTSKKLFHGELCEDVQLETEACPQGTFVSGSPVLITGSARADWKDMRLQCEEAIIGENNQRFGHGRAACGRNAYRVDHTGLMAAHSASSRKVDDSERALTQFFIRKTILEYISHNVDLELDTRGDAEIVLLVDNVAVTRREAKSCAVPPWTVPNKVMNAVSRLLFWDPVQKKPKAPCLLIDMDKLVSEAPKGRDGRTLMPEERPGVFNKLWDENTCEIQFINCSVLYVALLVDSHWLLFIVAQTEQRITLVESQHDITDTAKHFMFNTMVRFIEIVMKDIDRSWFQNLRSWRVDHVRIPSASDRHMCGADIILAMKMWLGCPSIGTANEDEFQEMRRTFICDYIMHPQNKVLASVIQRATGR